MHVAYYINNKHYATTFELTRWVAYKCTQDTWGCSCRALRSVAWTPMKARPSQEPRARWRCVGGTYTTEVHGGRQITRRYTGCCCFWVCFHFCFFFYYYCVCCSCSSSVLFASSPAYFLLMCLRLLLYLFCAPATKQIEGQEILRPAFFV